MVTGLCSRGHCRPDLLVDPVAADPGRLRLRLVARCDQLPVFVTQDLSVAQRVFGDGLGQEFLAADDGLVVGTAQDGYRQVENLTDRCGLSTRLRLPQRRLGPPVGGLGGLGLHAPEDLVALREAEARGKHLEVGLDGIRRIAPLVHVLVGDFVHAEEIHRNCIVGLLLHALEDLLALSLRLVESRYALLQQLQELPLPPHDGQGPPRNQCRRVPGAAQARDRLLGICKLRLQLSEALLGVLRVSQRGRHEHVVLDVGLLGVLHVELLHAGFLLAQARPPQAVQGVHELLGPLPANERWLLRLVHEARQRPGFAHAPRLRTCRRRACTRRGAWPRGGRRTDPVQLLACEGRADVADLHLAQRTAERARRLGVSAATPARAGLQEQRFRPRGRQRRRRCRRWRWRQQGLRSGGGQRLQLATLSPRAAAPLPGIPCPRHVVGRAERRHQNLARAHDDLRPVLRDHGGGRRLQRRPRRRARAARTRAA
mmetsp:Transcript_141635/g.394864  ORF Transcript_141635/g.394864 Transcript_141635/m.394864 type:complete len:485 (+) Transcript_141635:443-1897(+)